ncbi:unnamed protein product, partial [Allacma fusca]
HQSLIVHLQARHHALEHFNSCNILRYGCCFT